MLAAVMLFVVASSHVNSRGSTRRPSRNNAIVLSYLGDGAGSRSLWRKAADNNRERAASIVGMLMGASIFSSRPIVSSSVIFRMTHRAMEGGTREVSHNIISPEGKCRLTCATGLGFIRFTKTG